MTILKISIFTFFFLTANGGWGSWGPSSDCSATCGTATKTKSRRCDNPEPRGNGTFCMLSVPIGNRVYDLVEALTEPCNGLPVCPSKDILTK